MDAWGWRGRGKDWREKNRKCKITFVISNVEHKLETGFNFKAKGLEF
jgi:hypothetical protein